MKKSILCGMLFFYGYTSSVGITTEPCQAHDRDGSKYTITYLGYIYSQNLPRYKIKLSDNKQTYDGYISWDVREVSRDPHLVVFFNRSRTKIIDLEVSDPFPCKTQEIPPLVDLDKTIDDEPISLFNEHESNEGLLSLEMLD